MTLDALKKTQYLKATLHWTLNGKVCLCCISSQLHVIESTERHHTVRAPLLQDHASAQPD